MSFNIEFSYSPSGFVTVKVPTSQLNFTSVDQAPFSLQYRHDATAGSASFPENPVSSQWTVLESNGFTTYTRLDDFPPETTISLQPLTNVSNPNYISFSPTGFQSRSATSFTVAATDNYVMPPIVTPPPMEFIAPTLDPNGIQKTPLMADGATSLPQTGRDSAYIVSFSERVSIPPGSAQSAFGGMPPGSTIVVTQMPTSSAYSDQIDLFSDRWHVQVTTLTATDKVNLSLTPKLQVNTYETTDSSPPIGTGTTLIGVATHWAKVTLDNDLYAGRTFDSGVLNVSFMDGLRDPTPLNYQTVALATSTSAKNVLYLGFPTPPPVLTFGDEIRLSTTNSNESYRSPLGGLINDVAGNLADGSVVSELTNTNIGSFYSQGTSGGFDVLDMSELSGRLLVEADYGFLTVYDQIGQAQEKRIYFYDKYILNDREVDDRLTESDWVDEDRDVTRFFGNNDSEYVVVGVGGGNELHAGNQPSGSSVRETDIVDYTRFTISGASGPGVTIDLGNSAAKFVDVTESIDSNTIRTIDKIAGFEGVVGSAGDDVISGSNTGNYLQGGAGDDILRGYSLDNASDFGGYYSAVNGDLLYDEGYLLDELEFYGGNQGRFEQAYFADSSDMLVGGAGMDTLYGGAGSDFLVDLDSAVMWGSNKEVESGELRDNNNSSLAERDAFMVRGSLTETATIENFHLSKNGTGLAGRSYDSHDSIIFSADIDKLIRDAYDTTKGGSTTLGDALFGEFLTDDVIPQLKAGMGDDLYHYVYDNLTFTQTRVVSTNDMELTATFRDKTLSEYTAKIGEVIIADLVTAMGEQNPDTLRFKNQAEVVELAWLADVIANTPEKLNPKMDLDMINRDGGLGWSFNDMEIAIALELLQAGTVRVANDYGVMASNFEDLSLPERIFNPGVANDTILGSAGKDVYDFIVQDFDVTKTDKDFDAGDDTIFDIGGNNDILAFSEATINELTFSAVQVGRESGRNSLRVDYRQTLDPDNANLSSITNRGEITLKGHFREGGRQATEFVEVSAGPDSPPGRVETYAMARTEYQYDRKGYVIAGSEKLVANDTFNAIMVGRTDGADEFVFKASTGGSTQTHQQKASIAGYSNGDKIDISAYVAEYGSHTHALAADKKSAVVIFDKTPETSSVDFRLELAFQESVVGDLQFLFSTPPPM